MSTAFIGVTVEQVQEEFSQFNITNITDFHGYISPSAVHPGVPMLVNPSGIECITFTDPV